MAPPRQKKRNTRKESERKPRQTEGPQVCSFWCDLLLFCFIYLLRKNLLYYLKQSPSLGLQDAVAHHARAEGKEEEEGGGEDEAGQEEG